ncbi:MAG: phosphate acyltransferase, partial [Defluviitaleaceae bacterium]|nr:phosphate acyltransferase [Defluviitaleaceae bacterium]
MWDIKTFNCVFDLAKSKKDTKVAVACAAESHVMAAANQAVDKGIASMILVGDEAKMKQIAAAEGIDLTKFEIINEPDAAAACKAAVDLVVAGKASALMKGDIDTSVVMRAALAREGGMRVGKKLNHIAVFESSNYHKLIFATDCAVNIAPDFDTFVDLIENTTSALHNLGIEKPKVALIAAKEKADDKMPVTLEWARLVELHK